MGSNIDNVRFEYMGNIPPSYPSIFIFVICSAVFNTIFYKCLPQKLTPLIKSYIISGIHASVCVLSVLIYSLRYEINLKQINRIVGGGVFGSGDEFMVYNIYYSCGYFIYDLILMLKHKSVWSSTAATHHIVILISFLAGLFSRVCHPCHFYFLAEELSTIPLNLKIFYHDRYRLYHLFSFLFVMCFFLSRLLYGTVVCVYAFQAARQFLQLAWNLNDMISFSNCLMQASLCILTRLLNFYWAILILRKIFVRKTSRKQQ